LEEKEYSIKYILKNKIDEKYYGFIYITINLINSKKYIGQRKFNKDWKYYLGSGTHIKRAISKYGRNNFFRKIVAIASSIDELNKLEINLIKKHNAVKNPNYYNHIEGGGSYSENKYSKETIVKMKKPKTKEHNLKVSLALKGRKFSEEHCKNISESKMGTIISEEFKKKHSIRMSGKNNPRALKVICINDNIIFETIKEGGLFYKIAKSNISACCKGKHKSAGKHPITKEPLKWMYYDEYIKSNPIPLQDVM